MKRIFANFALFLLQLISASADQLSEQGYKVLREILHGTAAPSVKQKLFSEYALEISPVLHALMTDDPTTIPEEYRHLTTPKNEVLCSLLRADDPWVIKYLETYLSSDWFTNPRSGDAIVRAFNPKVLPIYVKRLNEELAKPLPNGEMELEGAFFTACHVDLILEFVAASPEATAGERKAVTAFGPINPFTLDAVKRAKAVLKWWDGLPHKERFITVATMDPWKRANSPKISTAQNAVTSDLSVPSSPTPLPQSARISTGAADTAWDFLPQYTGVGIAALAALVALVIRSKRTPPKKP